MLLSLNPTDFQWNAGFKVPKSLLKTGPRSFGKMYPLLLACQQVPARTDWALILVDSEKSQLAANPLVAFKTTNFLT